MTCGFRSSLRLFGHIFLSASACSILVACDGAPVDSAQSTAPEEALPRVVSIGESAARALLVLRLGDAIVAADPIGQLALSQAGIDAPSTNEETGLARIRHASLAVIEAEAQSPESPKRDDLALRPLLRQSFVPIVEVDPHNLEDAYTLYREIAALLRDSPRAERLVRRLHAPLVTRASRQLGRPRPCVAVVTSLSPLTLAGGHSFETDAVQILGAESTTHADESWRTPLSFEDLAARAVDLVIVTDPLIDIAHPTDAEHELASRVRPAPVHASTFDPSAFWLDEPAARRAILDRWDALIEERRGHALREDNCSLDPSNRPRA